MAETVTLGLSKIEISDLAGDGGPGSTFAKFGQEYEGSTSYTVNDGTDVEIKSDVQDDPVFSILRNGSTVFNFEIVTYDADVMAAYMGGTAAAGVYSEPDSVGMKEQTVKITPEFGMVATINRGSMTAKMVGKWSRDGSDPMRIAVSVKVLKPTKTGVARVTWTEPA